MLTNRNQPMSLSVPFNHKLLDNGVNLSLAIGLYEQGTLTLAKAAKIARLPIQDFLAHLATYGIDVVEQTDDELLNDLATLGIK